MLSREEFKNPEKKYRVNIMNHAWPNNYEAMMEAINDYGYGGAVINCPFDNGFTSSEENMNLLEKHIKSMKKHNLYFWIYDEAGYPSGFANGLTLKNNPELESKGFYMRKVQAFENKSVSIEVDNQSDKMVYAIKYPFKDCGFTETCIDMENGVPLVFNSKYVETELESNWVLYAFITKSAYEGAHTVHNVCSKNRYINIMSKQAVKTFIDVAYEPIAKNVPEAYKDCVAVFTDEPSLMTSYCREYEKFDYALAPWEDTIFTEFEKKYGYELQKYLPYLFEGNDHKGKIVRVDFYNLVGEMIGTNFTKQLGDWCAEHGAIFSGHYLSEESLINHVGAYGNFVRVLKDAPYPGMDILECTPEIYNYNTAKYINMAARKSGASGFMVELCPFFQIDLFNEAPYENMIGTVNLLYMAGVRKANTYFMPKLQNDEEVFIEGYLDKEEANKFNEYIARLGTVLDHAKSLTNIFIYYPIEDIQAKFEPENTAITGERNNLNKAQKSIDRIAQYIHCKGYNYDIIDSEDLLNEIVGGKLKNTDQKVDIIIVPEMDYIHNSSLDKLKILLKQDVKVVFENSLPKYGIKNSDIHVELSGFIAYGLEEIIEELKKLPKDIAVVPKNIDSKYFTATFSKNNEKFCFIINGEREQMQFNIECNNVNIINVYDIESGEINIIENNILNINGYRGVFVNYVIENINN